MENFHMLMNGFQTVFTLGNLGACMLGSVLGLIVGAMPGIGSLAGVALLLPLTYKFSPTTAIIMLGALYYSNMYGGAFSAILLNIPGDSPAVMTTLDGYPLAKRGRPGQALLASNMSSFIGGIIGMVILTFTGPALAKVGLHFGPSEMTMVLLVAMTSIGWLVGDNPTKGIVVTGVGILIASIGMDTLTGSPRYTFGSVYMLGGIPFTPFVIGLVGFAQVIKLMEERKTVVDTKMGQKLTLKDSMLSKNEAKRIIMPSIRSGVVGTFIGVLPGAGATTGSFIGYAMQRAFKNEEPLGTGAVEGIAACESANNAAAAGAFAPLLALQREEEADWLRVTSDGRRIAFFLHKNPEKKILHTRLVGEMNGLLMWGLNPGPLLFTKEPEFAWGLISSLYLSNIIALVISLAVIPFLIKILSVPIKYMIPCITVVCMVGAYSTSNSMYGVIVMFLSGILGYILEKNSYPTAPMLLAFVLAPMLESNMRKSFIISQGSLNIFFEKPISLALVIIMFVIISVPIIKPIIKKLRAGKVQA
ncbi:MAG: tripartite tricarboxylate transporter permease [Angelakisella sp.]